MKHLSWLCAGALLIGCSTSQDPADGGFVAGLSAINDGTYDQRITEREDAVEVQEARQAELQTEQAALDAESAELGSEIARLGREHDRVKQRIVALRSQIAARRISLDAATKQRVNQTIAEPGNQGETEAERVQSLQRAIAEARELADDLARLSS